MQFGPDRLGAPGTVESAPAGRLTEILEPALAGLPA
jgi:hypothetical protein